MVHLDGSCIIHITPGVQSKVEALVVDIHKIRFMPKCQFGVP